MPNDSEDRKLRKIYSEIINGFSIHQYGDIDIYIKHFSSVDNLEIDYLYSRFYDTAVKKGYPTEEERIQALRRDGLWAEEKDIQLENLKTSLQSFYVSKRKAYLLRDITSINEQIKEAQDLWIKITVDKEQTIGSTAEKYAKRQVDAYFISKSFYKDRDLKDLLFTKQEFDDMDSSILNTLYSISYEANMELEDKMIKKIALQGFFMNVFCLAENIYEFFQKPISRLTDPQIKLCEHGGFFKSILTNPEMRPPNDIISNPEMLEDWYYGRSNADEALKRLNKDGETGATLVGLTKADRDFLGIQNPERVTSMADKIRDAGGELDMNSIMRLDNAL